MLFWDLTKLRNNNFFGKILLFSLSVHIVFIFSIFLISKLRKAIPVIVIGSSGKAKSAKVSFAATSKLTAEFDPKCHVNKNFTNKKTIDTSGTNSEKSKINSVYSSQKDMQRSIINKQENFSEIKESKSKAIAVNIENKQKKANKNIVEYTPINLNNKLEFEDSKSIDKKLTIKKAETDIGYSKIDIKQDQDKLKLKEEPKEKDKIEAKYTKLDKDKTILLEKEIIKEEIKLKEIKNNEKAKKDRDKKENQEIKLIEKDKVGDLISDKKIDYKAVNNKSFNSGNIEINESTNNSENKDIIINYNVIYQNDSITDWEQKLVLDISQNLKMPHGFEKHEPLIVTLNINSNGKANIEEFEGCSIPALKASVANFFQNFIFPAKMHGTSRKLIIK